MDKSEKAKEKLLARCKELGILSIHVDGEVSLDELECYDSVVDIIEEIRPSITERANKKSAYNRAIERMEELNITVSSELTYENASDFNKALDAIEEHKKQFSDEDAIKHIEELKAKRKLRQELKDLLQRELI